MADDCNIVVIEFVQTLAGRRKG
ncbi:hypothetical protein CCACVL1_29438 [Corchorus capsularis]|uniref:Uncharacterized protein n=1 Tax=Corchorus capsularis TaxID=210143 RepID=A0A1R3G1T9_COCAP|nr:hypothetical protein CCACVL1_29438 [Corchorus capsularis]